MHVAGENVEARWRALWDASPQRSSFSRLDYVRAVAAAADLEVGVHFVEEDGVPSAGAAVTWRKRGPYRIVTVPPFTPFTALMLRAGVAASDVHSRSSSFGALLRDLERSYDAVQIHLHPSISDVRPATWGGWDARPLYTYVLPIERDADVTAGWSNGAARNFHGARSEYELVEGREAAAAALALCRESYARHGRSAPLPLGALKNLVAATTALSRPYAVRRLGGERRIDAAVILLSDAGRAYYWIAGGRPGNGMTVLIGELLSRFDPAEVALFDFVGANTPTIAEFKRRFGSRLETYYSLRYYGRRDLRLLYMLRGLISS